MYNKRSDIPYEKDVERLIKILKGSSDKEALKLATDQLIDMAEHIDSEIAKIRHFEEHGWN